MAGCGKFWVRFPHSVHEQNDGFENLRRELCMAMCMGVEGWSLIGLLSLVIGQPSSGPLSAPLQLPYLDLQSHSMHLGTVPHCAGVQALTPWDQEQGVQTTANPGIALWLGYIGSEILLRPDWANGHRLRVKNGHHVAKRQPTCHISGSSRGQGHGTLLEPAPEHSGTSSIDLGPVSAGFRTNGPAFVSGQSCSKYITIVPKCTKGAPSLAPKRWTATTTGTTKEVDCLSRLTTTTQHYSLWGNSTWVSV